MSAKSANRVSREKPTKPQTQTTQTRPDIQPNKTVQASAEQIRIAQLATDKAKDEEMQKKIDMVMELTGRSKADAALALHDNGDDVQKAINMLLEGNSVEGEWEESAATKKKKRQQHVGTVSKSTEDIEVNHKPQRSEKSSRGDFNRDRSESAPRIPRNAPPRLANRGIARGRDFSRGDREWKGKENEENDRNRDDSNRRGRGRGRGRGGRGRGGGSGGFGAPSRPNRFNNEDIGPQIDTWSNETADKKPKDTWDSEDWSVEEWTGSLAETQVYTATSSSEPTIDTFSVPTDSFSKSNVSSSVANTSIPSSTSAFQQTRLNVASLFDKNNSQSQFSNQYNKQATENLKNAMGLNKLDGDLGSLGSNQFSKEATESLKTIMGIGTSGQMSQGLQQRTVSPVASKHQTKTKLPPPSKIPAGAVEMPSSTYSTSLGLDLQFGNLDLGKEAAPAPASFSFGNDDNSIMSSGYHGKPSDPTGHLSQTAKSMNNSQSVLRSGGGSSFDQQQQSSMFQSLDSSPGKDYQNRNKMSTAPQPIPFPTSDRKSSPLLGSQRPSSGPGSLGSTKASSSPQYGQTHYGSYSAGYTSKPPSTSSPASSYNTGTYSQSQYGSNSGYQNSDSYSNQTGFSSNQTGQNSLYQNSNQQSSFAAPSVGSNYDNQYQTDTQGFQSANTAFNQSGVSQSSSSTGFQNYVSTPRTSTLQGSPITTGLSKYGDSSSNTASLTTSTTTTSSSLSSGTASVSSALELSTAASSLASTAAKASASGAATGKAPPNLPPGVSAPLMGGQNYMIPQSAAAGMPGMPFYGLQALQQIYIDDQQQVRSMLMPQQYYDMSAFQLPTNTMGNTDQVRLNAGLAYSGSDGKLNRVDAQSPVQASQSSQQQPAQSTHQAYINPATAMPPAGYGYYYPGIGGNLLPGQFPYNPAVFPQGVANTATHGNSSANQQYQKPGTYGSHTGYSTGYDDLSQNQAADFAKTGYGVSQTQSKGSPAVMTTVSTGVADLSSVYSKPHAQTAFDKQGYGSTPPPFNLGGMATGSQGGGMPTAGTPYGAHMYVPTVPHQQMMHQQLAQDATSVAARGSQQASTQPKTGIGKGYGTSHYWSGN